jgi:hypothetical protein
VVLIKLTCTFVLSRRHAHLSVKLLTPNRNSLNSGDENHAQLHFTNTVYFTVFSFIMVHDAVESKSCNSIEWAYVLSFNFIY